MATEVGTALQKATMRAVEGLCGVSPSHASRAHEHSLEVVSVVSFSRTDAPSGALVMRLDRAAAHYVADLMIPGEKSMSDALVRDALHELASVICASTLASVADPRGAFDVVSGGARGGDETLADTTELSRVAIEVAQRPVTIEMWVRAAPSRCAD